MNFENNVHPGLTCLVLFVAAYFLGGIPFGVLVARAKGVDIMKFGSGNIGATNVMRALGAPLGIFVFVLDVIKGTIPSLVARWLLPHAWGPVDAQVLWMGAGLMAVIGHCLSPFLKFKGGKGVATAFGIGLSAAPLLALSALGFFAVILATTRLMALASAIGVSSTVILGLILPGQSPQLIPFYVLIGGFVTYRHRSNFARIRAGTEPKFSFKRTAPAAREDSENPSPPVFPKTGGEGLG